MPLCIDRRQQSFLGEVCIPPWEWRASQRDKKQSEPQLDTKPPVIIIGERQNTISSQSFSGYFPQLYDIQLDETQNPRFEN